MATKKQNTRYKVREQRRILNRLGSDVPHNFSGGKAAKYRYRDGLKLRDIRTNKEGNDGY